MKQVHKRWTAALLGTAALLLILLSHIVLALVLPETVGAGKLLHEVVSALSTAGLTMADLKKSMPAESVRMAIAFVIAVPIACIYPFFQKYFISGLTVGAVKG